MLGKGLESLIPPSQGIQQNQNIKSQEGGEYLAISAHSKRQEEVLKKEPSSTGNAPRSRSGESVFHIEIEKIHSNPYQPRKTFNEKELNELAQSIREVGVIQPIIVSKIVREIEDGTSVEYQLVAGERRLMASKILGFERIPAIIRRVDSKQKELELALIENIQRSNLSPLESAKSFARLSDEFGLTQREIATRVGKSRETVANTMRLLQLSSEIQDALRNGVINESQARTLLTISDPTGQKNAFDRLLSGKMSVRELRTQIHPRHLDPEIGFWKKRLEEFFGASVQIVKRKGKGKVTVHFHSDDEWHAILRKLLGDE